MTAKVPTRSEATRHGAAPRRWWPVLKRVLTVAFFVLVAYLLITQARAVDWAEVLTTLRRYTAGWLLAAAGLAAASYAVYSSYDLLSRRHAGHTLGTGQVLTVTFISYAFNLNFGALVGGMAFRYRLYSRLGLDSGVITRVLSFSMLTNWLGYLLLGGLVFSLAPLALPPDWKIDSGGLRWLGGALLGVAAGYLLLCGLSSRREWTVRGHTLALPSFRMAGLQLAVSSANWLLISGVLYLLLRQQIDYPTVLSVLLVAAVAGVITHVPAGLGVLEAVFVTLLSHHMPRGEVLAAVLAYRLIYYLVPLGVATVVYLGMEARAKRLAGGADNEKQEGQGRP